MEDKKQNILVDGAKNLVLLIQFCCYHFTLHTNRAVEVERKARVNERKLETQIRKFCHSCVSQYDAFRVVAGTLSYIYVK